jgi:hypothetical protein
MKLDRFANLYSTLTKIIASSEDYSGINHCQHYLLNTLDQNHPR